jgi:hypothetical protein
VHKGEQEMTEPKEAWTVDKAFPDIVVDQEGKTVAAVYPADHGDDSRERIRLICAAPDMLEALEKLARLGNGDQYGTSIGNRIAIDALRKAKGERNE